MTLSFTTPRRFIPAHKERAKQLELIKEEEERLAELNEEVVAWHRSQQMRQYIQAVRDLALKQHGAIEEGSKLCEWLTWAEQQADRLDPLVESPASVLDEKGKYQRSYYGW